MIKTNKVIYRTRTQEEFDWLMKKLEADELIRWATGSLPTAPQKANNWRINRSETCIALNRKRIIYSNFECYKNDPQYKDYEIIEV